MFGEHRTVVGAAASVRLLAIDVWGTGADPCLHRQCALAVVLVLFAACSHSAKLAARPGPAVIRAGSYPTAGIIDIGGGVTGRFIDTQPSAARPRCPRPAAAAATRSGAAGHAGQVNRSGAVPD